MHAIHNSDPRCIFLYPCPSHSRERALHPGIIDSSSPSSLCQSHMAQAHDPNFDGNEEDEEDEEENGMAHHHAIFRDISLNNRARCSSGC